MISHGTITKTNQWNFQTTGVYMGIGRQGRKILGRCRHWNFIWCQRGTLRSNPLDFPSNHPKMCRKKGQPTFWSFQIRPKFLFCFKGIRQDIKNRTNLSISAKLSFLLPTLGSNHLRKTIEKKKTKESQSYMWLLLISQIRKDQFSLKIWMSRLNSHGQISHHIKRYEINNKR